MVLDSFTYTVSSHWRKYSTFLQASVAHVTHQPIRHPFFQTMVVSCIAQSSCPLLGESWGPLDLASTTSTNVCCSLHWPLKRRSTNKVSILFHSHGFIQGGHIEEIVQKICFLWFRTQLMDHGYRLGVLHHATCPRTLYCIYLCMLYNTDNTPSSVIT